MSAKPKLTRQQRHKKATSLWETTRSGAKMPSKHAKKLACEIVADQFGEQVAKVCQTLVDKGQHAFPDLGRVTELPPAQLRSCLLVLSQHNCVQAYRVEPDAVRAFDKIFRERGLLSYKLTVETGRSVEGSFLVVTLQGV